MDSRLWNPFWLVVDGNSCEKSIDHILNEKMPSEMEVAQSEAISGLNHTIISDCSYSRSTAVAVLKISSFLHCVEKDILGTCWIWILTIPDSLFYGFVHFQYSLNYDRSDCGAVILALIGFGWIERVLLPHRGYNPTLDPHSLPFKWISTNWDKYFFSIWDKYNLQLETNTFGSLRQNME